ncbi:unnamed protein product, partial [Toxocara canis]|uniref:Uncharacterized protein n=1 Tax=Toxocara canis TaxID=6265 RepID=A0A183U005_TOXCA
SGFLCALIVFRITPQSEIVCTILFACLLIIQYDQRESALRIAGQVEWLGAGLRACPNKGTTIQSGAETTCCSITTLASQSRTTSSSSVGGINNNAKGSTSAIRRNLRLYLVALLLLIIPGESGGRPIVIRSPEGYNRILTDSDDSTELYLLSEPSGRLYPMSGIATIGGGAASFQPVAALSVNLMPPFDYTGSHLLANCARQAQQLRRRRHEPRLEPRYDGPNREGALFCRSGTWVQILDKTTAEYEARRNDLTRPEYVRGTRNENSRFSRHSIIFAFYKHNTQKLLSTS